MAWFAQGVAEGAHNTLANVVRIKQSHYDPKTPLRQAQRSVQLAKHKHHYHALTVSFGGRSFQAAS